MQCSGLKLKIICYLSKIQFNCAFAFYLAIPPFSLTCFTFQIICTLNKTCKSNFHDTYNCFIRLQTSYHQLSMEAKPPTSFVWQIANLKEWKNKEEKKHEELSRRLYRDHNNKVSWVNIKEVWLGIYKDRTRSKWQ